MNIDFIFIMKSIIIAIIEGLTEFIPVSSTGHMILASSIIDFHGDFTEMFEVVIQFGAILSVVAMYFDKIKISLIDFFKYIFTKGKEGKKGFKFGINIIIASIPMGIIGCTCYKYIKSLFSSNVVVYSCIIGGILLLVSEGITKQKKKSIDNVDSITSKSALITGVFQCLSVIPGMSRSASTIIGGWIGGMSTKASAEFTFFLAIPLMLGASLKDLSEFDFSVMNTSLWISLIIGFIVAFFVSLIVNKKFINYLKNKPMKIFAQYRIVIGIIFLGLIMLNVVSI